MNYFTNKVLDGDFNEVIEKVTNALKEEGFGVLTEVDVTATFKKKLDVDFRNYRILGACSPPNALEALTADPHIGLMLPCNVVVQETEDGKIEVAAIDPKASMAAVENKDVQKVAERIKGQLETVINKL